MNVKKTITVTHIRRAIDTDFAQTVIYLDGIDDFSVKEMHQISEAIVKHAAQHSMNISTEKNIFEKGIINYV